MAVLSLMLVAIAVCITVAGLFLSTKTQASHQQEKNHQADQRARRSENPIPARRSASTTQQIPARTKAVNGRASQRQIETEASTVVIKPQWGQGTQPRRWTPWVGASLILLSFILLSYLFLNGMFSQGILMISTPWLGNAQAATPTSQPDIPTPTFNASQDVVRIAQLDPNQYASTAEYNQWAMSTCSAASMTEVMNAYGRHYHITDVLRVEIQVHEITPELGLLEPAGIDRTASKMGFHTIWSTQMPLSTLISIANSGRPVIVSFPPEVYPGGHIVVVTGGDNNNVYIADSSVFNRHSLTHAQFMAWWRGFNATLIPDPLPN